MQRLFALKGDEYMFNFILWVFAIIGVISIAVVIGIIIESIKDDSMKIIVNNNKINDIEGVLFREENNGNKYALYNFPDENYYGIIKINIKEINEKTLDKILIKLKSWANNEKNKNARIKAYQNLEVL
jgi:negative regulator of genetic competence, sporulation and motility